MRGTIFFLLVAIVSTSCERLFMRPESGQTQLEVFDEYAKICVEKYALSEVKNVDLALLRDSIRPYISNEMSDEELFEFMSIITLRMREGHTQLNTTAGTARWDYFEGFPPALNQNIVRDYYFGPKADPDAKFLKDAESGRGIYYGLLPQNEEIGYIQMSSFNFSPSEESIDEMMEYLKDTKGLIIDDRGNQGGFISFVSNICSRFTDKTYYFGTNYIKSGPGKDDFSPSALSLQPAESDFIYLKPVVILTDRVSFSSGSLFPVMMAPLDHVTIIGQRTGGGTGNIIEGYLANGWKWVISTGNLVNATGFPTDNGTRPDIQMLIDTADSTSDAIIERAIQYLQ